jgi:centrosomal protein CEP104
MPVAHTRYECGLAFAAWAAQVGIIALNLIGERATAPVEGPPGFLQLHPRVPSAQPYYNAAAADVADINL